MDRDGRARDAQAADVESWAGDDNQLQQGLERARLRPHGIAALEKRQQARERSLRGVSLAVAHALGRRSNGLQRLLHGQFSGLGRHPAD